MPRNRNRQNNHDHNNSQEFSQRELLNLYLNLYNDTSRQIDLLYISLDEIRNIINNISGVNRPVTSPRHIPSSQPFSNDQPNPRSNQPRSNQPNPRFNSRSSRTNPTTRYDYNYVIYPENVRWINNESNPSYNNNYLNDILQQYYNNVPVTPSQHVLNRATRTYRYSEITNPINTNCPITLERFESNSDVTMLLGCGHVFNTSSIHSWFTSNVRCPVCRYDIRDYIPTTTSTTTNEERKEEERQEESKQEDESKQEESKQEESKQEERKEEEEEENLPNNIDTNNLNNLISSLFNTHNDSSIASGLLGLNSIGINNGRFMFDASNDEIVFEGFIPPRRS